MKLKASLDLPAKIITLVYAVFCLAFCIYAINICFEPGTDLEGKIIMGSIAVLLFGILIFTWLYSPKYYVVTSDSIVVNRAIGKKAFLLSEIESISLIAENEIKSVTRVMGVGGLFGYFGRFQSHNIGMSTFYTTQRKNLTLLRLKNGKKVVLSPDENTSLINVLNRS